MKISLRLVTTTLLLATTLPAGIVHAHHPLNGMPMDTFVHGLLSGVAHPVLGFDHLFFILAVGVVAAVTRYAVVSPLLVIAGVFAGVGLSVLGWQWPLNEYAITLSLLLLGGIAMAGRQLSLSITLALFAGLGVFHGLAFGEALVGQQSQAPLVVVSGYLLGLTAVHWLLAVLAGKCVTGASSSITARQIRPRLVGAMVTGVGVIYLLEGIEPLALSALGVPI